MIRTAPDRKTRILGICTSVIAFSLLFSACSGAQAPKQADLVATYAVQTLTAIPLARASQAAAATDTPQPTPTLAPPTDTPTPTAIPATPTPVAVASGPTGFPNNYDPLTGLPVSDPTILNRRPVMVKVSNWPATVRPQSGLSSADLVFEYYIGEGMNRFVALFYGQNTDRVGSIRSGRLIDAQLAPLYQAVLASSGAYYTVEWAIERALGNRVINEGAGPCPMFCRDAKIPSPNNLFGDTSQISAYAQSHGADPKTRQNLDGMAFDPAAPTTGKTATQVAIQINEYDRGEWRYDPSTGKYLRWIDDGNTTKITMVPLTDANTKQQLAFANVAVIFAPYTVYAATMNDVTSLSQAGQGGKAMLFRDGQELDCTWKSQGKDKPLEFLGSDGKAIPFKPGNSWIAIMGSHSSSTVSNGQWEIHFNLP